MKELEKKRQLCNFRNALLNVAPEYYGIPALNGQIHMNEKAFAFELYHQLRSCYGQDNWYVNGELRKGLNFLPCYKQNRTLIPDLVIHQHETTTNNIIAIWNIEKPITNESSGVSFLLDGDCLEIIKTKL